VTAAVPPVVTTRVSAAEKNIPVFKSPVVVTAGAAAVPAIKTDCCPEVIVIAVVSAV
jgi:hypothetical protein